MAPFVRQASFFLREGRFLHYDYRPLLQCTLPSNVVRGPGEKESRIMFLRFCGSALGSKGLEFSAKCYHLGEECGTALE